MFLLRDPPVVAGLIALKLGLTLTVTLSSFRSDWPVASLFLTLTGPSIVVVVYRKIQYLTSPGLLSTITE